MDIEIHVLNINTNDILVEKYQIDSEENAQKWAENLVDNFNRTLRPYESPRKLIKVEIVDDSAMLSSHKWEKQNLVAIIKGNTNYDEYKCKICGVTGKRKGLSSYIRHDSKYQAKCYDHCETALKQMAKNKERGR